MAKVGVALGDARWQMTILRAIFSPAKAPQLRETPAAKRNLTPQRSFMRPVLAQGCDLPESRRQCEQALYYAGDYLGEHSLHSPQRRLGGVVIYRLARCRY